MNETIQPIKIFFAYSREDELFLKKIRKTFAPLERDKKVELWCDAEIIAGSEWDKAIKEKLNSSDIILLLLSIESLASNYFWNDEVNTALNRHQLGECKVAPIVLKSCAWKHTPLKHLQILPKGGEPVESRKWVSHDEAYTNIFDEIELLIKQINDRRLQKEKDKLKEEQDKIEAQRKRIETERLRQQQAEIAERLRKKELARIHGEEADNKHKFWEKLKTADTLYDQKQYAQALNAYIALQNWGNKSTLGATDTQPHISQRIAYCRQERQTQRAALLKKIVTGGVTVLLLFFLVRGIEKYTKNEQPTIEAIEQQMVQVEGGTFTMGCTTEQGNDCYDNEKPAHKLTVSSFKMSKYEVTQAQWVAVMGSNPYYNTGCDNCPVEGVSWDDVQEFLKRLNSQTGKQYRLPTEAEWEYAARGGANKRQGYKYAGSNNIEEVAWYSGNYESSKHGRQGTTHPVGGKTANELGIYDMSGNVWEWCSDWYDENYYTNSLSTNPKGASGGSDRVIRGGGWSSLPRRCRVAYRHSGTPDFRGTYVGFRIVVSQFVQ